MKVKRLMLLVVCASLVSAPALAKDGNKSVPPGLQKKQQNGQPLPPGWQKKLAKGDKLDDSIYARGRVVVPVGTDGSISIQVEGTILRLHEKTREILEILR